jgi:hypothetical protein
LNEKRFILDEKPCNCNHSVINDYNGYKNEKGESTNTIEGLWGYLKTELMKRKGVDRESLERFVHEFLFKNGLLKITIVTIGHMLCSIIYLVQKLKMDYFSLIIYYTVFLT